MEKSTSIVEETIKKREAQYQILLQERWNKKLVHWKKVQKEWDEKLVKIELEYKRKYQERDREHEHEVCVQRQHTLFEVLTTRFPNAPFSISSDIWKITDVETLQQLIFELIKAKDIDDFAQVIKTYADAAESQQ